ncbi:hypothetical protein EVAR_3949_1 [Eumeta japonica]|uniref:Uncharacterized protein n=1 Tax=Eumeta variegata TaxID=151549 RepID=A0A4C1SRR9_EUMVA|nr:hypothetical protein EVAR_3949_1 [Eumeta japonica]
MRCVSSDRLAMCLSARTSIIAEASTGNPVDARERAGQVREKRKVVETTLLMLPDVFYVITYRTRKHHGQSSVIFVNKIA